MRQCQYMIRRFPSAGGVFGSSSRRAPFRFEAPAAAHGVRQHRAASSIDRPMCVLGRAGTRRGSTGFGAVQVKLLGQRQSGLEGGDRRGGVSKMCCAEKEGECKLPAWLALFKASSAR